MPETKTQMLEREYVIPLRRAWLRVPKYERTGKAIKAIKIFIAKHMKVPDRDIEKVKLDVYFNNELWFKGRAHPPAKIKVRAIKDGENIKVNFAETPEYIRFLKSKHDKVKKKAEIKIEEKKPDEKEEKIKKEEEKTEEQKTAEQEKEKALEQQQIKQAEQQQKAQKHITKIKEPKIQRMALKK
ncbi:50S ribosomal protein L31e [Candidatus Pacearchaeota archaeon]|nr:50S ribosomal protein L31e [Candidatus Pacearchaeota archaeon]